MLSTTWGVWKIEDIDAARVSKASMAHLPKKNGVIYHMLFGKAWLKDNGLKAMSWGNVILLVLINLHTNNTKSSETPL